MDYAALRAEIALPQYSGLSDAEAAAALLAQTVAAVRDVPAIEAKAVLLRTTEYGAVQRAADGRLAVPAQIGDICITMIASLNPSPQAVGTIDAADDGSFAMLQALVGALVAASIIAQPTAEAMLALRDITITRAEQIGCPGVTAGDIQTVRAT